MWKLLRTTDLSDDADYFTTQVFPTDGDDPNRGLGFSAGFDGNSVVKIADMRAILVLYTAAGARVAPTGTFNVTVLEILKGANSSPLPIIDPGVAHTGEVPETPFDLTLPGSGEYILRLNTFAGLPGSATEGRLFVKEI